MYNLVKGMWNKLTKKEEPDLTDPDVPVLNLIVVEPVLDPVVPVDPVDPVEVVYIVLNDFEMETMADEDIPIEKKKDVVLDLDPIINIIEDPIIVLDLVSNVVLDPIVEEEAVILNEEEVKKPKKAKKLKKS